MNKLLIIFVICCIALMPFAASIRNVTNSDVYGKLLTGDEKILITEWEAHQIIEVDSGGNILWNLTDFDKPQDAEILPNGDLLITDYASGRVFEMNREGLMGWLKPGLNQPVDAERLPNGNTLITEFANQRVIEVDYDNNIVWEKDGLSSPFDADRLPNGNTLIVESFPEGRIIEVNTNGDIVWEITNLSGSIDAERLENNITLVTEHIGGRVFEIDLDGTIIWEKKGLLCPKDAIKLPNGDILIAECGANRVIQVNYTTGNNVWVKSGLEYPVDIELLPNDPPTVEITNPKENYFHFQGIKLLPLLFNTVVYGSIKIQLNTTSSSEIQRAEFYINDKLKREVEEEPFTYRWTPILCGKYTIKVIVYDNLGQNASDEIQVLKWRVHPALIAFGTILMIKLAKNRIRI